jgi:small-conductance mechanosensitive channel
MRRTTAFLSVLAPACLLLVLLAACGGAATVETVAPEIVSTSATPDVSETVKPEATSPLEEEEAGVSQTPEPEATIPPGEEDVGIAEAAASRTPVPTPVPGPVTELVSDLTASTGMTQQEVLGLAAEDWINLGISALMALVGYLLGAWLIRGLLRRVVRRTSTEFDDEFLEVIGPQLQWLILVIAFQIAIVRLRFLGLEIRAFFDDVFFLLYLAIGFSIVWRLLDFAADWYRKHLEAEEDGERLNPIINLLHRAAQGFWIVIATTILLTHFGVSVVAISASLGIAGLAISLAAQDTLADVISGFIILVDQPFRVGVRIEISGLGTWGDVVHIGARTTRIRTRDNRMVIVPNSTIGKSQVVNYTFPDPRYRIQMDIGVGYGTDIEQVRRIIMDTVSRVEGVLTDKPVDALYVEMGDSAMIFRVRWWLESYVDTRQMFDRVNTALQKALDEAGIDMPYPTHNLNLQVDQETAARVSQAFKEPNSH